MCPSIHTIYIISTFEHKLDLWNPFSWAWNNTVLCWSDSRAQASDGWSATNLAQFLGNHYCLSALLGNLGMHLQLECASVVRCSVLFHLLLNWGHCRHSKIKARTWTIRSHSDSDVNKILYVFTFFNWAKSIIA